MLATNEILRFASAVVIATILGLRGYKKRSLSYSGSIAAFIVGGLSWASSLRFGLTLIAFYLFATRITRYKADLKKKLEDDFQSANGNRNAAQVFASSLPAVLFALTYLVIYRSDAPVASAVPLRSQLLLAYMLFFAACAGDTFASELGLVMPRRDRNPILITSPWRRVPRGTNGGVSMEGTLASAVGGFVIGLVFFLAGPHYSYAQLHLLTVGVLGGVCGSAFDSLLGALMQASWLDMETGKVMKVAPRDSYLERYKHICGRDLLSGEAVNCLSAVLTSSLAPVLLSLFQDVYIDY